MTNARGRFPSDRAAVELLWPAIIDIEDDRARRQRAGKCSDQPARLVEGQRVMGWLEALDELDLAYWGRLRRETQRLLSFRSWRVGGVWFGWLRLDPGPRRKPRDIACRMREAWANGATS